MTEDNHIGGLFSTPFPPNLARRQVVRGLIGAGILAAGGSIEASEAWAADSSPPSNADLNVKDFGAKGDGHTDDTHAVRDAISAAAAANTRLHFPAGVYVLSDIIPLVAGARYSISGEGMTSVIQPRIPAGSGALTWWFGAGAGSDLRGSSISVDNLTFDGRNIPATYSNNNQGTKTAFVLWGGASPAEAMADVSITNCRFLNLQNRYQPTQRSDVKDHTSANYWNKGSGGINVRNATTVVITGCRFDTVHSYPIILKDVTAATISGNLFRTCFNACINASGGTYVITGNVGQDIGTYGVDIGESGEQLQTTNVTITGNSFESMAWYYGVCRVQGAVNYSITGNVFSLIPMNSNLYPFYPQRRHVDEGVVAQCNVLVFLVKQPPTSPAGSIANMVCAGNVLQVGDIIQHGIYGYLDSASDVPIAGFVIANNTICHRVGTNAEAITRAYIRVARTTRTFSCGGIAITGNVCTARYAPSDPKGYSSPNDRPLMVGGGNVTGVTGNVSGVTITGNTIAPANTDGSVTNREFLNLDLYVNDVVIAGNNCGPFQYRPFYTPDITYAGTIDIQSDAFGMTQTVTQSSTILPISRSIPVTASRSVTMVGEAVKRKGQKDGTLIRITNVSASPITLPTGTTAGLMLSTASIVLTMNSTVTLMYDLHANTWREVGRTLF